MNENETNIGICWFQPEQWGRLIEISEDREKLGDNYEEWRKNASRAIANIESQHQKVQKLKVNLEELLAWCNENNLPVIGSSRADYAAYLLTTRRKK